ncbi:class I SAM-dependent methyltransferase [Actinocrispum wychmicini]|uniref:Ubiquinone/menaquinone biosynthesis C-methylase UbiE n=1 Tax=Actinocrispum wychmicini TaxID=1213861 RepID=A0A4R2JQS8_9PSEU|nr:class I SAM-dependent methyltransferase [Actinocrispum wychmicini]TCO56535.1 ubiquinone/menaquinone biosynthesis C-methylase UbiE [Actinocrispum wychmicini]
MVRIDPSNNDQLKSWDGASGDLWVRRAERLDRGVAGYWDRLFDAAAIKPDEHVLDIGCGSGITTREAARRASSGTALGVDLSSQMIDLARRRTAEEGLANVTFEQVDAQVHSFPDARFDLVVSRNGVMFFGDRQAAFTNIARATRPGGRLVLMVWGPYDDNEWIRTFRDVLSGGKLPPIPSHGPTPFSLSDPGTVTDLLTSAGFTEVTVTGMTAPMYYGEDVEDAADYLLDHYSGFMTDLDDEGRAKAAADLRADLANRLTDEGVVYRSSAWLVQARRPGQE